MGKKGGIRFDKGGWRLRDTKKFRVGWGVWFLDTLVELGFGATKSRLPSLRILQAVNCALHSAKKRDALCEWNWQSLHHIPVQWMKITRTLAFAHARTTTLRQSRINTRTRQNKQSTKPPSTKKNSCRSAEEPNAGSDHTKTQNQCKYPLTSSSCSSDRPSSRQSKCHSPRSPPETPPPGATDPPRDAIEPTGFMAPGCAPSGDAAALEANEPPPLVARTGDLWGLRKKGSSCL